MTAEGLTHCSCRCQGLSGSGSLPAAASRTTDLAQARAQAFNSGLTAVWRRALSVMGVTLINRQFSDALTPGLPP